MAGARFSRARLLDVRRRKHESEYEPHSCDASGHVAARAGAPGHGGGREEGEDYDATTLDADIKSAVNALVDQQVRTEIDFVNDGEQSKSGFSYYIGLP